MKVKSPPPLAGQEKSKVKIAIQKAKIISNLNINHKYFKLTVNSSAIAKNAQPGQFVQVKVSDTDEPLLRRPFSIHRVKGANLEILYEVVGKGTKVLSGRKAGENLDIIGPLGNGFNYGRRTTNDERRVLVTGGMGVAPLFFLAEKIKKNYPLYAKRYPLVLIGAKTKSQILCESEFKKLGCEVKIATDDGSRGFRGKVTDLLKSILRENERTREHENEIYACGPRPMLKEISRLSREYKIPAQVSLEEHMACGIGACLGCVVNTKEGYKRVCKEGPVFKAREIIW